MFKTVVRTTVVSSGQRIPTAAVVGQSSTIGPKATLSNGPVSMRTQYSGLEALISTFDQFITKEILRWSCSCISK